MNKDPECARCHRQGTEHDHFWHLDDGYDNVWWFCDGDCFMKWIEAGNI